MTPSSKKLKPHGRQGQAWASYLIETCNKWWKHSEEKDQVGNRWLSRANVLVGGKNFLFTIDFLNLECMWYVQKGEIQCHYKITTQNKIGVCFVAKNCMSKVEEKTYRRLWYAELRVDYYESIGVLGEEGLILVQNESNLNDENCIKSHHYILLIDFVGK